MLNIYKNFVHKNVVNLLYFLGEHTCSSTWPTVSETTFLNKNVSYIDLYTFFCIFHIHVHVYCIMTYRYVQCRYKMYV